MTPDAYWQKLTGLFEYLGGLDQLYEVFRETRGLANALGTYAHLGEISEYCMTIDYGLTNSAHTVGHIGRTTRSSVYTLGSQLPPSSTTVMLDVMTGYMFWNNVHHVVESIGIGCHKLYGEGNAEGSKINSMLRDQSYNLKGPRNELFRRLMPWCPVLVGGGQHLSEMLMKYAVWLGDYRVQCDNTVTNLTLIPLGIYDTRTDLFSSKWITHQPHIINKSSKGTHHTRPEANLSVHKSVVWSQGLGMDGNAIPFGGVLIAGSAQYPSIPARIRETWRDMDGTYRLMNVSITLSQAKGRPGSAGPVATLFAPMSHALACGTEEVFGDTAKEMIWQAKSSLAVGAIAPGTPEVDGSSSDTQASGSVPGATSSNIREVSVEVHPQPHGSGISDVPVIQSVVVEPTNASHRIRRMRDESGIIGRRNVEEIEIVTEKELDDTTIDTLIRSVQIESDTDRTQSTMQSIDNDNVRELPRIDPSGGAKRKTTAVTSMRVEPPDFAMIDIVNKLNHGRTGELPPDVRVMVMTPDAKSLTGYGDKNAKNRAYLVYADGKYRKADSSEKHMYIAKHTQLRQRSGGDK